MTVINYPESAWGNQDIRVDLHHRILCILVMSDDCAVTDYWLWKNGHDSNPLLLNWVLENLDIDTKRQGQKPQSPVHKPTHLLSPVFRLNHYAITPSRMFIDTWQGSSTKLHPFLSLQWSSIAIRVSPLLWGRVWWGIKDQTKRVSLSIWKVFCILCNIRCQEYTILQVHGVCLWYKSILFQPILV